MSAAVAICEYRDCGWRGSGPLVCAGCGSMLAFVNRENLYCPSCDRYLHLHDGPCDGCGRGWGPGNVHFEPLD